MFNCHGKPNQMFYFEGKAIKTMYHNKCLDYTDNEGFMQDNSRWFILVMMNECDGSASQQWYFDGKSLKTEYANNCLYSSGDRKVLMNECNSKLSGQR